jgi:hypothetical protein
MFSKGPAGQGGITKISFPELAEAPSPDPCHAGAPGVLHSFDDILIDGPKLQNRQTSFGLKEI